MNLRLKIGELARRAGCPAETIRYYEREGLLAQPARTAGNYRVYSSTHMERLSFIRNCRSLDMTLDEIRQLLRVQELPQENCEAAHRLLDEHLAQSVACGFRYGCSVRLLTSDERKAPMSSPTLPGLREWD